MAALKPCRTCGHKVAKSAPTCPSCGVERPIPRRTGWGWLLLLVLVLWASMKLRDHEAPRREPVNAGAARPADSGDALEDAATARIRSQQREDEESARRWVERQPRRPTRAEMEAEWKRLLAEDSSASEAVMNAIKEKAPEAALAAARRRLDVTTEDVIAHETRMKALGYR